MTPYQAERIDPGTRPELVLGPYRVLDRLGTGEQGVVFRGEHAVFRTEVAVKVRRGGAAWTSYPLLPRIAAVRHSALVPLLEVGEADGENGEPLRYLVRPFVGGVDLEQYLRQRGLLPVLKSLDVGLQVAAGLAELHGQGLLHGRLRPSNVFLTVEGQVRLVDVDVAQSRQGDPWGVGQLEWLAPEQLRPGAPLDERTDLYALGLVLFWCLSGESLFAGCHTVAEALHARRVAWPSLREFDPTVPVELDRVVQAMLAEQPTDRPSSAREVVDSLSRTLSGATVAPSRPTSPRVLLAAFRAETLACCRGVAGLASAHLAEAGDWDEVCRALQRQTYDLVMLAGGAELCRKARALVGVDVPLLVLCEPDASDQAEQLLLAGADDVVVLPQGLALLDNRLRLLLSLREARSRAALWQQIHAQSRPSDTQDDAWATVDALVSLLCRGAIEGRGVRLRRWVRLFAGQVEGLNEAFVELLVRAAPLVDLGERLQEDEAARLLREAAAHHLGAWGFLQTALDLVCNQQERDDGRGVPDGKRGGEIPLAARLVAPCLAYDKLRSPGRYRAALSHELALEVLDQTWQGAFDPGLKQAFFRAAAQFPA